MKPNRTLTLSLAVFSMVILVLDTKTALNSALAGMDICLRVVIPSLFPFFCLSAITNDWLLGANLPFLRPIAWLCKIPKGSETLLLLGLVGGYPVGAAGIYNAYRVGTLEKKQATRMLAFCNNAGPAFLFGMLSPVFGSIASIWVLWGIHILSAITVAALLPNENPSAVTVSHTPSLTLSQAMSNSIRNIGFVCGWVLLFRIILGFCNRWFLWLLPQSVQVLFAGFLELSNGCLSLTSLSCNGLRFVYASIFLSFGGICVGMQTTSVIGSLSAKTYWLGKAVQTAVSLVYSTFAQRLLFPDDHIKLSVPVFLGVILLLSVPFMKKAVAFPKIMGYNEGN